MKYNTALQALNRIVDMGNDAHEFIVFRMFLEALEKQAQNGDAGAEEIVNLVKQVANLIDVSKIMKK